VSETRKEEQVQYVPVQMMPMGGDEDEIDLLDLWRILVKGKWIIAGVTLCCVLAGVGYALLATPVYKVETYFLPPTSQDVQELSVEVIKGSRYDPQTVYDYFIQNLQSRNFRRSFFKDENLIDFFTEADTATNQLSVFERKFNQLISVEQIGKKNSNQKGFYLLSFVGNDPKKAMQWVNDFVALIMEKTRSQLLEDVRFMMQHRIVALKDLIASKRKRGAQQREDEILRLTEAFEIAQKLQIADDKFAGSAIEPAAIYNTGVSYLRGTKSLEAQIAALKNRKTDDPYIEGLRELQEELELLASISIDPEKIRVARIDQPAFVPRNPIKPKKNLIVALSCVGGVFLGIFAVFFVNFLKKARQEDQDAAA
jgi:chain length determinant protein (polysaccharide antigen chain regulator)